MRPRSSAPESSAAALRAAAPIAALAAAAAALALALAPAAPPARAQEAPAAAESAAKSIRRGLDWLVTKQNANGSFGVVPGAPEPGEPGVTGLAIRALARAPAAARTEAHQAALDKAVAHLLALQQEDGSFALPGTGLTTYRTAIGIMALIAVDAKKYAEPIRRGRDFLVSTQFSETHGLEGGDPKKSPHYGGFGYDATGTRPDADMSNGQFALDALRQAGLDPSSETFKRAQLFLSRCQNRSESNDLRPAGISIGDDGGFMYDPALDTGKSEPVELPTGEVRIPSYASVTYMGLMSLLHANVSKDDARVKAAYGWIRSNYTLDENHGLGTRRNPKGGKQGLYYYYHVFAKALAAWGEPFVATPDGIEHVWSEELIARLVSLQKPEGYWVNDEPRWWENDPTLVTCYSLLALEIANENLPEGAGAAPGGKKVGEAPAGGGGAPAAAGHAARCCREMMHTMELKMCQACGAEGASCKLCADCAAAGGECPHCRAKTGGKPGER